MRNDNSKAKTFSLEIPNKHKQLTVIEKLQILWLRYGDFKITDNIHMSTREVGNRLGMPTSRVTQFISRLKRIGYIWRKRPVNCPRKITGEMAERLESNEVLQQWQHMSSRERVREIYQRWGVSITNTTLLNFYRSKKIKYLKPSYKFYSRIRNPHQLFAAKTAFARVLLRLIKEDRMIIYFDETTVSILSYPNLTHFNHSNLSASESVLNHLLYIS